MNKKSPKNLLRLSLRILGVLVSLFILVYIILLIYLERNKKSIIEEITAEFSQKINGKVSVGDAEISIIRSFPRISVLLKNVEVYDSMFNSHNRHLLKAEELYISLSIKKLVYKDPALNGIKIKNGQINMFTDQYGYTNSYLLKPENNKDSASQKPNEFKFIELKNTVVTVEDMRKNKLHRMLAKKINIGFRSKAEIILLDTDILLDVGGLGFNRSKGDYLSGQQLKAGFTLKYNKHSELLSFERIPVQIGGQLFRLSGNFLMNEISTFNLEIETLKADYEFIRKIVPSKISKSLSIIRLDQPIDANVKIDGLLKGGIPLVNIRFAVKDSKMATPFFDFDDAGFEGGFTNEVTKGLLRNDSNSLIQLRNFNARWHNLPIKSRLIEIVNLKTPVLTCDLESDFPLTNLNELINSRTIQLKNGNGSVKLSYKGPLVRNNQTNSFLNGTINFSEGEIYYAPREVELKKLSAEISFKDSDLFIRNMRSEVLGHDIRMDGFAKNLLTMINTEPNKVNISWNIFSPSVNLSAFTYLLKKRKGDTGKKENKGLYQVADKIDAVLERGRLDVNFHTNQLNYKKFSASNVKANLSLLNDRYLLNQVIMNHAGGSMELSGALINSNGNYHRASINATMNNMNVNKLFTAFGNFGQDGITAANLNGNLSSKVNASMMINEEGAIQPSSLEGVVDFSLKDGELFNYEPVKKLQKFVFKNRNFENIRFAEIKDRFTISNREVKIGKMEIQSSVMTLFVEGLYSQKGNTDISIQVPLSNLKKRGDDYNPENIGVNARRGSSIFLRGRPGPDGNIKFKLDFFNKYGKENK